MIKKTLINVLDLPIISSMGLSVFQQYVPVFMLHRFQCNNLNIDGHDTSLLRFALEYMRKKKFNFVSIDEVALAIKNQELLPERSVAFTLDDGYWDQVEATSITFANYDCPATYYVTTGFIDEDLWFWDARIRYIYDQAKIKDNLNIKKQFPNIPIDESIKDDVAAQLIFGLSCKPLVEIEKYISDIALFFEVDIPANAPDKYKPTSWDRLNHMVRMGMLVGAHTHSHPILSRENDEDSKNQIFNSRDKLKEKVTDFSKVFCYPVGRAEDFGVREERFAKEAGYMGAVSTVAGPACIYDRQSLFSIPRYGFPDHRSDVIQYASWIESFKTWARSKAST